MRKLAAGLVWSILMQMPAMAAPPAGWPTVDEQLARDRVIPDSPLEALVRANQDFRWLRPEEAHDKIPVPLWLRVWWRKAHPEGTYRADDPTGGYPHVLREIHEWMSTHQDLEPGLPKVGWGASLDVLTEAATAGLNLRVSGAQSVPRSESDIRVNYWDPQKILAASNNIGGSGAQGQYWSTDGGATWGQTTLPLATGDSLHSDPTVDWTSDGTAWSTTIGITAFGALRMQAYRSTDNGATWTWDATFSGSQTATDKQMIWVDHSASSPYEDNLYVCWHNNLPQFVNRRTASGWGTPLQISGAETTGTAIGCDVRTNANGDVFVFWPATGNHRILMAKSTNGGASYATPVIVTTTYAGYDIGVPSFNGRRALIYVTGGAYRTATKDLVYAAWTDLSGEGSCTTGANEPGANTGSPCKTRIWFARSTDGGATWSTPQRINPQAALNDQFNPWVAVDETNGQIGIVYYDTVEDSGRKKTNLYYQASYDDGASWSTPLKVTTATTDETVAGADSGNQYGDYNSLTGHAGSFWPSWTDRRSNAREEIWTANVLDSTGPCMPPAAPSFLTAVAASHDQINLSWPAVPGATEYRVLRSSAGGPYNQIGTTANLWFNDTGRTCSTSYSYVVRAVSACVSGDSMQASATTAVCPSCSTQTLYSNDFETGSGLGDWTRGTFVSGGSVADWVGIQACTAASGSKIFRFGGSASCTADYANGDFTFAQPNGAGGIAVPAGSTTTRLSFWHRRAFESGYDGGTVLASVNGTNYFVVPASAIVSGTSYNGTTSTSCPPTGGGGLPVFTGTSASFTNTVMDLGATCNTATGGTSGCAGQSVRIGFTSVTDCLVASDGWFLDDVTVTACTPVASASSLDFYTVTPCRVIDTRLANGPLGGPSVAASSQRSFALVGSCGVPVTAKAVVYNLTVVAPATGGNLIVYPANQSTPNTTSISFPAGLNRANNGVILLSPAGAITVKSDSAGKLDFVLDVTGYFQ